ncbi:S24 family peptidase [Aerococcaceae bacterium 50-4]
MYDIKSRRQELGLTLEQVGDMVGVGKSTVRKWEQGMIENMRRDKISLLASALKISPLLLINDEKPSESTVSSQINEIVLELNDSRQNKVYSFAERQLEEQNKGNVTNLSDYVKEDKHVYTGRSSAAGSALYVDDADVRHDVLPASMVPNGADEQVEINGHSMEPLIQNGDKIYIRYQPTVENGEIAIVRIENEGVTCKRVYVDGDTVTLKSENEEYSDMFFSPSEITILGKVLLK